MLSEIFPGRRTQVPSSSITFFPVELSRACTSHPFFLVLFSFSYYKKELTVEAVTGSLSYPYRWLMTSLYPADSIYKCDTLWR